MEAAALYAPAPLVRNPASGDEWAVAINHCYGASVLAVIETGRQLLEAKKALDHGEWSRLFDSGVLRFSQRTAQRFMQLADHPKIGDPSHAADLLPKLPNDITTLSQLVTMPVEDFDSCVDDGSIHPEMRRSDASTLRRRLASGGAVQERVQDTHDTAPDEAAIIETATQRLELLLGKERARAVAPSSDPAIVAIACMVGGALGANFADMWDADNMTGPLRTRARDARSAALYVLHIGLSVSQPRCAKPFGLESSAVSRIAQRVTDWRDEPHWDRFFDGMQEAAEAVWDILNEGQT